MKTGVLHTFRRGLLVILVLSGVVLAALPRAGASVQAPVDLGTAGAPAVLGGQTVTNTGPSVINGDLGVSPGSAITGFPPGIVNGTIRAADAVTAQAQADVTIAYNDAAGRAPDANLSGQDLVGLTLTEGVYKFDTASQLTGTLTLDAQGNPDAVFIFQVGSTFTTASNSTVSMTNGAQACNVFWQIGSSATLGTNTTFVGNVLALTSITAVTGTTVDGRLLARNGAVTLDTNVVTRATCTTPPGGGGPTTVPGGGGSGGPTTVPGGGGGGGPTTVPGGGGGGGPTTVPGGGGGGGPTTTMAPGGGGSSGGPTTTIAPGGGGGGGPTTVPGGGGSGGPTTTIAPGGGGSGRQSSVGSTSTSTVIPQTVTTSAGSSGTTTTRPTSPGLARTGGGFPLRTFALALLLVVGGCTLRTETRRRPAPRVR